MVEGIRYGAGGIPMVNQEETRKVEPVEKHQLLKKKRRNLFKKSMVKVKKTTLTVLMKNMEMTNEDILRIRICQSN